MNIAADIRAAGFDRLLGLNGEPLTFRTGTVTGIVDRSARGQQNLQEIGMGLLPASIIELRKVDLSSNPSLDEILTDAGGLKHRIRLIQTTGFTWKLTCAVSGV